MGFFDDVVEAVSDTVSTGVKKALDLAEPLIHAYKEKDARVVPGRGGYVYAQYPDGSIIIKEGPSGLHDVKVKNGSKAWKAVTDEIGPWVSPAVGEGDDEIVIFDNGGSSAGSDEEEVTIIEDDDEDASDEVDPYERLETALDDLDGVLGRIHDNGSSGKNAEMVDQANALYDKYPEIVRRLGEAGDIPDDIVSNYMAELESVRKQLLDADFEDEQGRWKAAAQDRKELLESIQDTPRASELQERFETIVKNAEDHYLYAMANAEWEQFALECDGYLRDVEAGLVPPGTDSEDELPEFHSEGASDYEFPVEVTVISTETDEGDTDLGLAAVRLWYALNGGYVAGDSVKEMVDAIIENADGRLISELTITGHGSSGDQNISDDDSIAAGFSDEKRKELARLKGYFADYAVVTLQGCEVGAGVKGEQLLKELASLWGVRVRGGVPYQRPVLYAGMEGSVTTAVPTDDGAEIEQDDAMTNEFWRTRPPNPINPAEDDVKALERVENATDKDLTAMSLQDRYLLAKTLISGYTGNDEGEAAVTLFRSATQADRRELYRLLECHEWNGDFHNGVFTDDDGLVDALSEPQLEELKYLLG